MTTRPIVSRLGRLTASSVSERRAFFFGPGARRDGRCEAGIFLDGSGIGMSVAANKVRGIRAALAHDEVTARLSREHNHCNVLCLGSDLLNENEIRKIISVFLTTPFGEGRHARRVEKLKQFEQDHKNPSDSSQWSSTDAQPPPS